MKSTHLNWAAVLAPWPDSRGGCHYMFALFDVSMRMDRVHLWRGNRIASREPQGNELPYKLMKHKTYILNSRLPAEKAIARVGDLLTKEGVQYRTEGLSIFSISMPIALLSLQRTLYSDRNWVGVNPFTFISGIDARCQLDTSGLTKIIVQVNKFRTFLWVAFWVCNSALAASAMPKPDGALLFIAVSLAAWFGFVSFLGGYLIKKEITDCLNA